MEISTGVLDKPSGRAKSNKRTRELLKLGDRRKLAKATKLHISTHAAESRTLKRGARRALHKQNAPYLWISPWIKDPFFRYEPRVYPAASLLGLPAELRHKILLLTRDKADLKGCTWGDFTDWTGNLSCLSPMLRLDMLYIRQVWLKEKVALEPPQPIKKHIWGPEELQELNIGRSLRKDRFIRGSQMTARSRKRRRRDEKCWHCEKRHISKNPTCPLSRENPSLWKQLTRPVRAKHPDVQGFSHSMFHSSKITFEGE
jgi:hypothetical protein